MSPKDARPLTTHLITPAVPALLQPRCLIFYPHGSQAKPEWSLISWQSRDLPLAFYQLLLKGRGGRKERTFSFALRPSFQSNRYNFGHRHPKNTRFSIRPAKLPWRFSRLGKGRTEKVPRFGPRTGTCAQHQAPANHVLAAESRGFRQQRGGGKCWKGSFL